MSVQGMKQQYGRVSDPPAFKSIAWSLSADAMTVVSTLSNYSHLISTADLLIAMSWPSNRRSYLTDLLRDLQLQGAALSVNDRAWRLTEIGVATAKYLRKISA